MSGKRERRCLIFNTDYADLQRKIFPRNWFENLLKLFCRVYLEGEWARFLGVNQARGAFLSPLSNQRSRHNLWDNPEKENLRGSCI